MRIEHQCTRAPFYSNYYLNRELKSLLVFSNREYNPYSRCHGIPVQIFDSLCLDGMYHWHSPRPSQSVTVNHSQSRRLPESDQTNLAIPGAYRV